MGLRKGPILPIVQTNGPHKPPVKTGKCNCCRSGALVVAGGVLADRLQKLEAVHPGHVQVEQNDVGRRRDGVDLSMPLHAHRPILDHCRRRRPVEPGHFLAQRSLAPPLFLCFAHRSLRKLRCALRDPATGAYHGAGESARMAKPPAYGSDCCRSFPTNAKHLACIHHAPPHGFILPRQALLDGLLRLGDDFHCDPVEAGFLNEHIQDAR